LNLWVRRLIVLAAFAAAIVVLMGDVLVGDRVLVTCNTFRWQPWRTYATEEQLSGKTYRTDSARTYLPRGVELSRRVGAGDFPLWNPYVFCGSPFLADPQARAAYPISLLLATFDPARALGYDIAIHLFVALLGMYMFLRIAGSTTLGSMIGAFAYGMSSFFAMRMGHPTFFASASWIPFFFYAFERARLEERSGTVMLTVFLALGYLAGFPQIFLFGASALVVYALVVSLGGGLRAGRATWLKTARILAVSAGLSLLLVCIQLVPFWELIRNSVGLGIDLDMMDALFVSKPLLLVRSVVPSFFGNPVEGTRWLSLLDIRIHPYNPGFLVYCGIGALVVALGGLALVRVSGRIRALFVLLALSVGLASSGFLLRIGYAVMPLFRYSQIDRIAAVACLAVAGLSGTAFSHISRAGPPRTGRLFACIVIVVIAIIVAGSVAFSLSADRLLAELMVRAGSLGDDTWRRLSSAKIIEWKDTEGSEWLVYERRQVLAAVVFALLSGLLVLGLVSNTRRRRSVRSLAGVAFLLVLILDVGLLVRSYYVSQPVDSLGETEGLAVLKGLVGGQGRWRVMAVDSEEAVLPPNTNQIYGIPSLQGLATIVPGSFDDLARSSERAMGQQRRGSRTGRVRPGPVSDLMCVRYIIDDDSGEPMLRSPVMRAVAGQPGYGSKIRTVSMGGRSEPAFVQSVGESIEVEVLLPKVGRLDFNFGVEPVYESVGGSVAVGIVCESGSRRAEFKRILSIADGGGRWHRASLDLSGLGGGYVALSLRVGAHGGSESGDPAMVADGPAIAWSGLDLVIDDCPLRAVEGGYEVETADGGRVVSLEVRSTAAEAPLYITRGSSGSLYRLITFPAGATVRTVMVRLPEDVPAGITIRSDTAFTIGGAKTVYTGHLAWLDYDLIYNGDMRIYENFAAVDKGICLDRAAIGAGRAGEMGVVEVAGLQNPGAVRCGSSKIVSCRPEAVVLDVSADRDCVLLFQDLSYPGWQAKVDGRERDMLRTDVGVRALEVGAGKHRVVMEFKPLSFKLGLVLTCFGVLLTVLYAKKAKTR
jgi:hypothetical protein